MKSLHEQIASRCVHFTGVQHEECAAGVDYLTVRSDDRPAKFACLQLRPGPLPDCAKRCWPSPEEVDQEVAESEAALAEYLAKLEAGECPQCGGDLEPRRQDGCCIYGACGHRIGQGHL